MFLETKLWENFVYRKTVCWRNTASRETWKRRGTDKGARDRRVELFFGVIQAIRQRDCEQSYVDDKIRPGVLVGSYRRIFPTDNTQAVYARRSHWLSCNRRYYVRLFYRNFVLQSRCAAFARAQRVFGIGLYVRRDYSMNFSFFFFFFLKTESHSNCVFLFYSPGYRSADFTRWSETFYLCPRCNGG